MASAMGSSAPLGGGPSGGASANSVERRRLAQLQQLVNGQQLTPSQLRRLYRLIDVDNDSKLKHQELQQGLVAMGFAEAASPEVITKLLTEIDTDRSGYISESEFVSFFQRFQLEKLQKKVASLGSKGPGRGSMLPGGATPAAAAAPEVTIDALVFSLKGVEGSTKLCARKKVAPERLTSFLQSHVLSREAEEQDHHCWLDVCGWNDEVLSMLSVLVGVDKAVLEDVFVLQAQKVEFVPAQESALPPPPAQATKSSGNNELAEGDDGGPSLRFNRSKKNVMGGDSSGTALGPLKEEGGKEDDRDDAGGGGGSASDDDEEDEEPAAHPHDSVRLHMLLHALALVNNGLVDGSLSKRTVRNICGLLQCRCLGLGAATGGLACCPRGARAGSDEAVLSSLEGHYGRIDKAVRERVLRNARTLARSFYPATHHNHNAGGAGGGPEVIGVAGAAVTPRSNSSVTVSSPSPLGGPPGALASYPSAQDDNGMLTSPVPAGKGSATVAPAPQSSEHGDHTAMHMHHQNAAHRTMSSLVVGGNDLDDVGSVALSEDSEMRRRNARVCGCLPASCFGGDGAGRGGAGDADEGAGPQTLASREHLNRLPPDLHIEQVSVVVVNERLIITLRPNDSVSGHGKGPAPPGGSSSREGLGHGSIGPNGPVSDSVISILFEGLKQRVRHCGDSGMHLYTSSIKALALDIADAITQFSSAVRDDLQEWKTKLEHDILTSPLQLHAIHLFSLQKMTGFFLRQMEPLRDSFQANSSGSGGKGMNMLMNGGMDIGDSRSVISAGRASLRGGGSVKGNSGVGGGLRQKSINTFGNKLADGTVDTAGMVARKRRGSAGMNSLASYAQQQHAAAAAAAAQAVTLQDYFIEESALIAELGADLNHMISDISGMRETCDALQTMRASLQSDGQNRILFVLTGFTVLATPLTILTGFYGMNFDPSESFPLVEGVNTFWIPAAIAMMLIVLLMWKIRFFSLIAD